MKTEKVDVAGGIAEFIIDLFFSLHRRKLLRSVGKEILGEKYCEYAVLEMKDVTLLEGGGFIIELLIGAILGPVWSFFNWIASLRAYKALKLNRDISVRVVLGSLSCKDVPDEVWEAFESRNPEEVKNIKEAKQIRNIQRITREYLHKDHR